MQESKAVLSVLIPVIAHTTENMEKQKSGSGNLCDEDVFTVSRNKPVDLDKFHAKIYLADDETLLNKVRHGKPKEKIDVVIEKMKSRSNYGGVYFKNYFRVDHPIQVTELGFYGPFDEEEAEYRVYIQMFAPRAFWNSNLFCMPCFWAERAVQTLPDSDSPKIAETRQKVSGKKKEIFYVAFPEPVYIEPGVWYLIDFRLDGPSTLHCTGTLTTASVSAGDTTVIFEFMAGSKQMPSMRFKLISGLSGSKDGICQQKTAK